MKDKISIALTTYGTQSYYTKACLSSIEKWKTSKHELIVACHDASPLLEALLIEYHNNGIIDKIIWTPSGYGHTKGVNKCFENASGDVFFNIANDICIGRYLVDRCTSILRNDLQAGLIGWHWYNDGTFWKDGKIIKYNCRDEKNPLLSDNDRKNIQNSKWFTGKLFEQIGPKWLQLCNTAFFGIRKELWNKIGGFSDVYKHYWADDFLNYAVLDQGLDVRNFEIEFRQREFFSEFQYDNIDVADRRRADDSVRLPDYIKKCIYKFNGGLSEKECEFLYQYAKTIPANSTITHIGLWRGAGAILFLDALYNKKENFSFIDCFDAPEISNKYSNQPPVTIDEFHNNIAEFISYGHDINTIKANTLEIEQLSNKSDVFFIDAGHTEECISHDLKLALASINPKATIIFHDYNQTAWPAIKKVVDSNFKDIKVFETIAIVKI